MCAALVFILGGCQPIDASSSAFDESSVAPQGVLVVPPAAFPPFQWTFRDLLAGDMSKIEPGAWWWCDPSTRSCFESRQACVTAQADECRPIEESECDHVPVEGVACLVGTRSCLDIPWSSPWGCSRAAIAATKAEALRPIPIVKLGRPKVRHVAP